MILRFMIKRFAIAVCLLPLVMIAGYLVLAALGGLIPWSSNRIDQRAEMISPPVFLIFTPIHTDFAIPLTSEVRKRFDFLDKTGFLSSNSSTRYLIIGWGSKAFYTSVESYSDIGFGPTWTAITGDTAVMHVQRSGDPAEMDGAIRLDMELENLDKLVSFVLDSFAREGGKTLPVSEAGFGLGDVFYEANGQFNILVSCNIWAAAGLRESGFATGFWTPTTFSLKIAHALFN